MANFFINIVALRQNIYVNFRHKAKCVDCVALE